MSFRIAELLYEMTVRFIDRYIPPGSRTCDQMEQAARSGARNIAEGSMLSATSKKFEMNLTNVARGSLDELRADYEEFLKQRKLPLWAERDPRRIELTRNRFQNADEVARWVKGIWLREEHARMDAPTGPSTARTPISIKEKAYAEISANVAQALCIVVLKLLEKQVDSQARSFEKEGGFSERLYRVRSDARAAAANGSR